MIPGVVAGGPNVALPAPPSGITFVGSKQYLWSAEGAKSFNFTGLSGGSDVDPQVGDYYIAVANEVSATAGVPGYTAPVGNIGNLVQKLETEFWDHAWRIDHGFIQAGTTTGAWNVGLTRTRIGMIFVFRGVDPITPLDVAVSSLSGFNSAIANPPARTPVTPGAWILALAGNSLPNGASFVDPTDMTLLRKANYNLTYDGAMMVAAKTDWVSGAFDPAAFNVTTNSSDHAWCAATIVLRPA